MTRKPLENFQKAEIRPFCLTEKSNEGRAAASAKGKQMIRSDLKKESKRGTSKGEG